MSLEHKYSAKPKSQIPLSMRIFEIFERKNAVNYSLLQYKLYLVLYVKTIIAIWMPDKYLENAQTLALSSAQLI